MMTHRERVLAAMNHRSPDRVPVDIGGTFASGINVRAYDALKHHLGLEGRPTALVAQRSRLALLDEDVLQKFDVDCRGLIPAGPENRPEKEYPDGSYIDQWGITWAKPAEGHFYVKKPIFTGEMTTDVLRQYNWPDPTDPGYVRGLREAAQALHEGTDYAVILCLPVGFVHQSQFLRGYDAWLMDLVSSPESVAALADAILEVWLEVAKRMIQACKPYVDIVFCGDDVAFQNGPMMNPKLYRSLIKPRHKRIFDMIKHECDAKILYHSCGSAVSLLSDLIEIGIDGLNPVQVSAAGMDTASLKKEFGRDLFFWGAIDTHRVLPFGTPDDVRQEVARRIHDLADGGGYVMASVHNIQAEVPPENILAMVQASRTYGS